jgi:hemerythrin-like domain-containing protein
MLDAVAILQLEHHKMGRLLGFVQQQAVNMARGAPVNHRLLAMAFEYLSGYPDQCHHPKEDVLYGKLVRRFPELAKPLENLVGEHEKLAEMTRKLTQRIGESRRDLALADELRAYLDFYHHHMLMEEQHFFPLAQDRLSRVDFEEVDYTLFDRPDPLFNWGAERKFAELGDEIERAGFAEQAAAIERVESALLATLADVAAFNEAMQAMGEPVALAGSPEEGYALERLGRTLVHIPACSEARAAWCAYFFWKAASAARRMS